MAHAIYNTMLWRLVAARARKRDGNACTYARLVGGECSGGTLHVHHLVPVSEGGAPYDLSNVGTACSAHHPAWESLRRSLLYARAPKERPVRCMHFHRTQAAREECERRMARNAGVTRSRVAA